ncbi:hypothetical protein STAS_12566 [Striga asiatica]|uniref:Uncharacterized protein n=1 Tax=Striga asiatica TaxID=4170 RepID=A0A5A7PTU5_STRAF|nr:hypothetical protein STAS_12566 [Striga asiatica]
METEGTGSTSPSTGHREEIERGLRNPLRSPNDGKRRQSRPTCGKLRNGRRNRKPTTKKVRPWCRSPSEKSVALKSEFLTLGIHYGVCLEDFISVAERRGAKKPMRFYVKKDMDLYRSWDERLGGFRQINIYVRMEDKGEPAPVIGISTQDSSKFHLNIISIVFRWWFCFGAVSVLV